MAAVLIRRQAAALVMPERTPTLPSCPFCWDHRHKCWRDPTTFSCRDCRSYLTKGWNPMCLALKQQSQMQYEEAARFELHRTLLQDSISSLNVVMPTHDYHQVISIQIISSTRGKTLPTVLHNDGTFDVRNKKLVAWLDTHVRDVCSASLRAKGGSSPAIDNSVLAGAYINFLCSTISATEEVMTNINGVPGESELPWWYGIRANITLLAFSRLCELLHTCFELIRLDDQLSSFPNETAKVFSSAFILRCELVHFRKSIRYGALSRLGHIPSPFKSILIAWFAELESELTHYLRLGCGKHYEWQDAIEGSKRNFRRSEETFSMKIYLDIYKFTVCGKPPPETEFINPAGGDKFLTSPHQSPSLQAMVMSYGILDGIEQLPSHVLTSVNVASDLFPDLQFLLRASDEDED